MSFQSIIISTGANPELRTHIKYLDCLVVQTCNLSLRYTDRVDSTKVFSDPTDKTKLIGLMDRSITAESAIKSQLADYSEAALPWIPAKVYYVNFHRICRLNYVINVQLKSLESDHSTLANNFTRFLEDGRLVFSAPLLNQTFTIEELLNFTTPSGYILSNAATDEVLYKCLLRHVAKYVEKEKNRRERWNLRKTSHRSLRDVWRKSQKISIFHHQMAMRQRTNYKDMSFIEGAPIYELSRYFDGYILYGKRFGESIDSLYEQMASVRKGF